MSLLKLIIVKNLQVQNANAISGFVHSAIGITQVLGFIHALQRQIQQKYDSDIQLQGSALLMHNHHVHTFKNDNGGTKFTQSRNPPYLSSVADGKKASTAPVIEEGRMNATVSLVIAYKGSVDNDGLFCEQFINQCYMNKFAGGTILDIEKIDLFSVENTEQGNKNIKTLVRSLLPSFVLLDRSDILAEHKQDSDKDSLNAWLDFIKLKQYSAPKHDLIDKYLDKLESSELSEIWKQYLENVKKEYHLIDVPSEIIHHFVTMSSDKKMARKYKQLLIQWQGYTNPTHKTDADWHYQPKPKNGFLVPIMCGYKAITQVYDNSKDHIQVKNTRDIHTNVCFAEAVHSIGEWQGIHRIKTFEDLLSTIWCYGYSEHWYLCKQNYQPAVPNNQNLNPYV